MFKKNELFSITNVPYCMQNKKFTRSIWICIVLIALHSCTQRPQQQTANNQYEKIIANSAPPKQFYDIKGGSCGEACLWTISNRSGKRKSQVAINRLGGNPGRGLHSNELFTVLRKQKIKHINISHNYSSAKRSIQKIINNYLQKGAPVLLGVKVYPTQTPAWGCDHFILLTGYNRKQGTIIFNDFTKRRRIKIKKLLNKKSGYSIINRQKYLFAIAFP